MIQNKGKNTMLRLLCALLLVSSATAYAQDWTKEEQTAGLKTIEFTRHISAGKKGILGSLVYLHPDCSVAEGTENTITKEPEHGTAVVETMEHFTSFAKDNVRAKCNEKRMKMPVITYKAAVGYAGTELFLGEP
jgi:hypothetical protein